MMSVYAWRQYQEGMRRKAAGASMRAKRLRANLTQHQLAAHLGVYPLMISRIECGYIHINLAKYPQLAPWLGPEFEPGKVIIYPVPAWKSGR